MGNIFNNGSMTMKLHILNMLYGLESHAKDGRCGLSRNGEIRRLVGKLVEKQTLHQETCYANSPVEMRNQLVPLPLQSIFLVL